MLAVEGPGGPAGRKARESELEGASHSHSSASPGSSVPAGPFTPSAWPLEHLSGHSSESFLASQVCLSRWLAPPPTGMRAGAPSILLTTSPLPINPTLQDGEAEL